MKQFNRGQVGIIIILLLFPVILVFTSFETIELRNKDWNAGYDPAYAYLYNSLNTACFRIVGHVDHPGTTMQVIGGVILRVAWFINPVEGETLTMAVIKDPETYLRILNYSVALIGAAFIFLAGLFVYKKSDALHYALIIQATPFISGIVLFNGLTRVSQESMLMISSISMACWSLLWYLKKDQMPVRVFIIGFAIITGFGLASKIIFAPLMVIPLILLTTMKERREYILSSLVAFVVFTIPIIPRYPHMLKWFLGLFTHSGVYGSGKPGIIDPMQYLVSLREMFNGEPVYKMIFISTFVMIIALFIIKIIKGSLFKEGSLKVLTAVFTAQTLGYLLVAKHPGLSYLMAYESLSALNIIVILDVLLGNFKISNRLIAIMPTVILVPVFAILINHGLKAKGLLYIGETNKINEQAWMSLGAASDSLAIIGVNPGPSPIAAHFFGNAYSSSSYSDSLQKVYPNHYILNTYNNQLINWNYQVVNIDSLYKQYGGNIVIMGNEFDKQLISAMLSNWNGQVSLNEDLVYGPRVLKPLIHQEIVERTCDTIFTGAEDSELNFGINHEPVVFDSYGTVSSKQALNGSKSVLTSSGSPYAFTFDDNNVRPGVIYNISVYARGDIDKANIVVAARNLDDLYAFADKKTVNMKNGWHLINMSLVINKQIAGETLRIYCYNTGKEDIYFDDFTLQRSITLLN